MGKLLFTSPKKKISLLLPTLLIFTIFFLPCYTIIINLHWISLTEVFCYFIYVFQKRIHLLPFFLHYSTLFYIHFLQYFSYPLNEKPYNMIDRNTISRINKYVRFLFFVVDVVLKVILWYFNLKYFLFVNICFLSVILLVTAYYSIHNNNNNQSFMVYLLKI